MAGDEEDAVAALKDLGLSEYEAKVFIALQRLGVGTAREIYRLADVPRSQVYGAAESLEDRGLLEIKQSKPMEYRPVSLEEAEARLESKFEDQRERAFTYLEDVRQEGHAEREEREDIWTVRGADTIDDRIRHLVEDADDAVVLAVTDAALLRDAIADALVARACEGVDVVVMSEDPDARAPFADRDGVVVVEPPEQGRREDRGGRYVIVDSETVLLSVLGDGGGDDDAPNETAIWSSDTGFATVLIQLTEGWLQDVL